jgi:hypothetical protein
MAKVSRFDERYKPTYTGRQVDLRRRSMEKAAPWLRTWSSDSGTWKRSPVMNRAAKIRTMTALLSIFLFGNNAREERGL